MQRILTIEVSSPIIKSIFRKCNIWKKIRNGQLTSRVINSRPSVAYPNSTSQIIKHFTANDKHVATTHRIIKATGQTVHWDAKDFRIKGICYWRSLH